MILKVLKWKLAYKHRLFLSLNQYKCCMKVIADDYFSKLIIINIYE